MKNRYNIGILLVGILFLTSTSFAQKTYVNREWKNSTGTIGNIQRTASALDYNGNLVVVGNTLNSSNNTDVLITKYNPDGAILWQKTFDGSANGNDYGVQLKINSSNEIFVAATLKENSSLDFGVLKYAANGNLLWSNTWNGSANGIDIPADIDIDNAGNVYLVGGTEASNNFSDYAIVKYKSDGVFQWATTYDYAGLHDAATSLTFNTNSLIVSGASASTPTNWDYATLEINKLNGAINNTKRTSVPGVGLDNVVAVTSDNNNNTYITGYVEVNGNRNIQTVKINSNFNLEWVKNFDGGLDDVAKAIGVDDFGNVYIAGTKENPNGGKDYITIKYNQNGTKLWGREFGSDDDNNIASAEKLTVSNSGDVLITGTVKNDTSKEFTTIKYTSTGDLKFIRKFDAGNQNNEAKSIVAKNNDVYVTGVSKINGIKRSTTVKYTSTRRVIEPRIVNGVPAHVKHEIIIRFDKSAMNLDAVNKRGFNFGKLSDFVHPYVINKMDSIYPSVPWGRMTAYKIFKHFKSTDTSFVNRLGNKVKIAPFWAILVINVGKANETEVCHALNINQPLFPTIKYVQTNGFVKPLTTDDPLYSAQNSLMSTTYPEGDINIEPAWNVETGSDKIKIGIIDTGVKWDHEDLGGYFGGPSAKVVGGFDYALNQSLYYTPNHGDPIVGGIANGHGTSVAGIIGALRNNSTGIAGIAGGNWPYANVPPSDGTQQDPIPPENNKGPVLYGYRALNVGFTSADQIVQAMLDAAVWTPSNPNSTDIINNSWKRTVPINDETINDMNLFRDCQRQIFRSGVINVCARGNAGNSKNYYPEYAVHEEWILNVGGSDKNGYKHPNSCFGGDVDLIAPYDEDIIYTTGNNSTSEYKSFSGTSASAPHVTGVAALMLSQIDYQPNTPNNLAPDDVEFLLQKYANDVVSDFQHPNHYANGYDDYSGWGLLDAGAVLQKIDRTQYIIKHIKTETNLPTDLSGFPHITGDFGYGDYNMPNGSYHGTIYQVSFTLQNNLNSGDVILNYWPLNSYTTLLSTKINPVPSFIDKEAGCFVNSMNNSTGDVRGTIIHLTKDPQGNSINYWYPAAPGESIRVGYTLHLKSDYAGLEENKEQVLNISCFPNPSANNVTLKFTLRENSDVKIKIVDMSGRVIYQSKQQDYPIGEHSIMLHSNSWSKGIYFIKLKANENYKTIKFIKQ